MSWDVRVLFNHIGSCDSSRMTWIEEVDKIHHDECLWFCSEIYNSTYLRSVYLDSIGAAATFRKINLSVMQHSNSSLKCHSYKWQPAQGLNDTLGKCTLWAEDWNHEEQGLTCSRLGGANQPKLTSINIWEDKKLWKVSVRHKIETGSRSTRAWCPERRDTTGVSCSPLKLGGRGKGKTFMWSFAKGLSSSIFQTLVIWRHYLLCCNVWQYSCFFIRRINTELDLFELLLTSLK